MLMLNLSGVGYQKQEVPGFKATAEQTCRKTNSLKARGEKWRIEGIRGCSENKAEERYSSPNLSN